MSTYEELASCCQLIFGIEGCVYQEYYDCGITYQSTYNYGTDCHTASYTNKCEFYTDVCPDGICTAFDSVKWTILIVCIGLLAAIIGLTVKHCKCKRREPAPVFRSYPPINSRNS